MERNSHRARDETTQKPEKKNPTGRKKIKAWSQSNTQTSPWNLLKEISQTDFVKLGTHLVYIYKYIILLLLEVLFALEHLLNMTRRD